MLYRMSEYSQVFRNRGVEDLSSDRDHADRVSGFS